MAVKHPYVGAAIAIGLCLMVVVLIRWVIRAVKNSFRHAEQTLAHGL
jgi:hypothetical protein